MTIDQVAEASIAALRAPSVFNTQPWRWRLAGEHGELWADRSRQLEGLDPDGRLLLLSCGAALQHATVALLAAGYSADVQRLPDAHRPDLVARLRQGPRCPPDDRLHRAVYRRRTDRRPFGDARPGAAALDELRGAAARHGVRLRVLHGDEVTAFAAAVAHARAVERLDPVLRADVLAWTARGRDGVPPRTVAWPAALEPGLGSDRGTVYAVLVTDGEEPRDWVAAGEALSEVWLTLTAGGLAASPISEVVEVDVVRHALRRLLGGAGSPAIALRIGVSHQPREEPR